MVSDVGHMVPRGALCPLLVQSSHEVLNHLIQSICVERSLSWLQQPLVQSLAEPVPLLSFPVENGGETPM